MSIKKEAAYHEASHAVLTLNSRFHGLVHEINLADRGAGEAFISLSRSKCIENNKPGNSSAILDKEVAREFATILYGGFIGEQIAAERDSSIVPLPECAEDDHTLAAKILTDANLSKKHDRLDKEARETLNALWKKVDELANILYLQESVSAADIYDWYSSTTN